MDMLMLLEDGNAFRVGTELSRRLLHPVALAPIAPDERPLGACEVSLQEVVT